MKPTRLNPYPLYLEGVASEFGAVQGEQRICSRDRQGYNPEIRALSAADWTIVLQAIPGLVALTGPQLLRNSIQVLELTVPTKLPAQGMYVVLDGAVSLFVRDRKAAVARQSAYFYEEYLALPELSVPLDARAEAGARLAFLPARVWQEIPETVRRACANSLFGDLVNIQLHHFQQPINCCNITAVALSLTALGFPCDVNDIFRKCALPISYVVNDGLTLGELYDVACSYICATGLQSQVAAQVYYLDGAVTSPGDLAAAIAESDRTGGEYDITIVNFDAGIAHNDPTLAGGHFALIAKCNQSTGLVHMMDVHPQRYGKLWVTTIDRLYEAISAPDTRSQRSRGLIRLISRQAPSQQRLQSIPQPAIGIDTPCSLKAGWSHSRNFFQRSSPNLNSLSVLAMSLRILGKTEADEDALLQSAHISYCEFLTHRTTPLDLGELASRFSALDPTLKISADCLQWNPRDGSEADWLRQQLSPLGSPGRKHYLCEIDFNKVVGYEAISFPPTERLEARPHQDLWCICVDYDAIADRVTLLAASPATSRTWQVKVSHLARGLKHGVGGALIAMQRQTKVADRDLNRLLDRNPLILFYSDNNPQFSMLQSVLKNIGCTNLKTIELTGSGLEDLRLRQQLIACSGDTKGPYLFLQGTYLGKPGHLVDMACQGTLQQLLRDAGLAVSTHSMEAPSPDKNLFSYPKGGLNNAPNGKRNILLCACGSSAADKIPELIERLVDAGHNVKLIPSAASERFFQDFGMERILAKIEPSDIYRNDDEWSFRYTHFGMPLRAAHLALCDWADCAIVAPITCNSMAKMAHGIADTLLTSVFVAWPYQKKPMILCPACNTDMWNNPITQNNVALLERLGVYFQGPRSGVLSNGRRGIGMMATPDEIENALEDLLCSPNDPSPRTMQQGREADDCHILYEWKRTDRSIDEGVVGINTIDADTRDTSLHFTTEGKRTVALKPRANAKNTSNAMSHYEISNPKRSLILDGAETHWLLERPSEPDRTIQQQAIDEARNLVFCFGSLKRGFPNYQAHSNILNNFIGVGTTQQAMPLIVSKEPNCTNPNCPYLHRMAALIDRKNFGQSVCGEVFSVDDAGLQNLDSLEGFLAPGHPQNVHTRQRIPVLVEGRILSTFAYFAVDREKHLAAARAGRAELVGEYTLEMAAGILKSGFVRSECQDKVKSIDDARQL